MLLYIINPSLYSALIPTLYNPTSTVMYDVHDIDVMTVSLLCICMMLDRYTLWIIAYLSNTLICL